MSRAIADYGLERLWQLFFLGSVLFSDVRPEVEGADREGEEEGCDLFLTPEHRAILKPGLVQVKASAAYAQSFLEEGKERWEMIPVVIGPPPERSEENVKRVLRKLANDFFWMPNYKEKDPLTLELEEFIEQLFIATAPPLRIRRPKWALALE